MVHCGVKQRRTIANTADETHGQLEVWRCHLRLIVVVRTSAAILLLRSFKLYDRCTALLFLGGLYSFSVHEA